MMSSSLAQVPYDNLGHDELVSAPIIRGESVKVLVDYDLFDTNVNGLVGIYLKTDTTTGKYLIYFPFCEEWGEINPKHLERISPLNISEENKEFISRVKTLTYTYGC